MLFASTLEDQMQAGVKGSLEQREELSRPVAESQVFLDQTFGHGVSGVFVGDNADAAQGKGILRIDWFGGHDDSFGYS
jgi:hypothetical protein